MSSAIPRSVSLAFLAVLAATVLFSACGGRRKPEREFPPTPLKGGVQEGISSWYGKDFDGRPTASGERFDMHALTAAHRTLPLGTVIRVTNLENDRRAVLTVNDRGPFIKGRILDCSYGAAKELGFAGAGLARVRVEVMEEGRGRRARPEGEEPELYGGRQQGNTLDSSFCVQVGAFAVKENALKFREVMEERVGDAYVIRFREFYRVRVGHLASEGAAEALAEKVREMGHEGFVTRNE